MISNFWLLVITSFAVLVVVVIAWYWGSVILGQILSCLFYHPARENSSLEKREAADNKGGCLAELIVVPLLLLFMYWIFMDVILPPELAKGVKGFVHSIIFFSVE